MELAKRLAAAKGLRWRRGMRSTKGQTFIAHADDGDAAWIEVEDDGCDWLRVAGKVPDLADAATIGCIEEQAREVWDGLGYRVRLEEVTYDTAGASPTGNFRLYITERLGRLDFDPLPPVLPRGEAWALCLLAGLERAA